MVGELNHHLQRNAGGGQNGWLFLGPLCPGPVQPRRRADEDRVGRAQVDIKTQVRIRADGLPAPADLHTDAVAAFRARLGAVINLIYRAQRPDPAIQVRERYPAADQRQPAACRIRQLLQLRGPWLGGVRVRRYQPHKHRHAQLRGAFRLVRQSGCFFFIQRRGDEENGGLQAPAAFGISRQVQGGGQAEEVGLGLGKIRLVAVQPLGERAGRARADHLQTRVGRQAEIIRAVLLRPQPGFQHIAHRVQLGLRAGLGIGRFGAHAGSGVDRNAELHPARLEQHARRRDRLPIFADEHLFRFQVGDKITLSVLPDQAEGLVGEGAGFEIADRQARGRYRKNGCRAPDDPKENKKQGNAPPRCPSDPLGRPTDSRVY